MRSRASIKTRLRTARGCLAGRGVPIAKSRASPLAVRSGVSGAMRGVVLVALAAVAVRAACLARPLRAGGCLWALAAGRPAPLPPLRASRAARPRRDDTPGAGAVLAAPGRRCLGAAGTRTAFARHASRASPALRRARLAPRARPAADVAAHRPAGGRPGRRRRPGARRRRRKRAPCSTRAGAPLLKAPSQLAPISCATHATHHHTRPPRRESRAAARPQRFPPSKSERAPLTESCSASLLSFCRASPGRCARCAARAPSPARTRRCWRPCGPSPATRKSWRAPSHDPHALRAFSDACNACFRWCCCTAS